MNDKTKLKIALTFDDAPSINESKIKFSPERMDTVRSILIKHKIKYCTAFVVGKNAIGHEDKLVRWLDAGYQLANHTFNHDRSSSLTASEFENTVKECHQVLELLEAFSGTSEQWFRFPYLDRGVNIEQRKEFQLILDDFGYKTAHASISFDDHRYELPMEKAVNSEGKKRVEVVGKRYISNVYRAIKFMNTQCMYKYSSQIEHIAYAHFGVVSDQSLENLLLKLGLLEIEWCNLSSASCNFAYRNFEEGQLSNGLVFNPVESSSIVIQAKRKVARFSEFINLFQQKEYGPLWAFLQ